MMSKKPKVLFLTYDGMTDPLGQSQVLSYLKLLSKDFSFDVLSYEKPDVFTQKEQLVHNFIQGYDIRWIPLPYTKSPPILSTIKDLRAGWKKIKELGRNTRYDIIHSRGYIIGTNAIKAQKHFKAALLLDKRGWWADEKKDSGNWESPVFIPVYRYFKNLETRLFKVSDHAISLTWAGYHEIERLKLKPLNDVSVIPTCVDFKIFKPFDTEIRKEVRQELGIPQDARVILYSGSLGGNYSMELIFGLYRALKKREPNTYILLLTRADKEYIAAEVKNADVPEEVVKIAASDFAHVHRYLMAGDYGLVNYLRTYSTIGRSPTKLGEYWACGLPVVSLSNIGDIDYLVNKYPKSGVLVDEYTEEGFDTAVEHLLTLDISKEQLREYSIDYYDIEKGVKTYADIYHKMLTR